jgi:hypothetical protein
MSTDSPEPPPDPATTSIENPSKKNGWFTLDRVIIGIIVLLALKALFLPFQSKRLTLQDWARKSATVASEGYLNMGQLYADAPALIAAVGEPKVTRTTAAKVYLQWKCKDGRVEAVVDRHAFEFGKQLIGEISFYRN